MCLKCSKYEPMSREISIYFFMTKKLEAAEQNVGDQLKGAVGDLSRALGGAVTGAVGTIGGALKSVLKPSGAAGAVAGTTAGFVGPLKPAVAAAGGMATTGGIFSGMSTVGIAGVVAGMGLWLYGMGQAIGILPRKNDPLMDAIERRLQEAKDAGLPVLTKISKTQLKAPDKRR